MAALPHLVGGNSDAGGSEIALSNTSLESTFTTMSIPVTLGRVLLAELLQSTFTGLVINRDWIFRQDAYFSMDVYSAYFIFEHESWVKKQLRHHLIIIIKRWFRH